MPNMPIRRGRAFIVAGMIAGAAAMTTGCGSSSSGDANADPATVVPATAPVYAEAVVQPEGSLKANTNRIVAKLLHTSNPGGKVEQLADGLVRDSDRKDNPSFDKTIKPWLGKKVGVAVTSLKNLNSPDYVIVAATKDTKKALQALKPEVKGHGKYKGVSYDLDDKGAAAAIVKKELVIGSVGGLHSAIDVSKGSASLASSSGLRDVRSAAGNDGLASAYVSPGAAIDAAGSDNPAFSIFGGTIKQALQSAGLGQLGAKLTPTPDAIRVEADTKVSSSLAKTAAGAGASASDTLADLPDTAAAAVGFGDLGAAFKNTLAQFSNLSGGAGGLDPTALIRQFSSGTGFDLDRDLLSWVGPSALFVDGGSNPLGFGGALVVQSKDPAATRGAIPKIRRLMARYGVPVTATTPTGVDRGFGIRPQGFPFPIAVGVKGDRFVIAVGADALKQALAPSSGKLGASPAYKAAATALGDGVKPAALLDVSKFAGFLSLGASGDPFFAQAKPILDALTTVAAGGKVSGNTSTVRLAVGVK